MLRNIHYLIPGLNLLLPVVIEVVNDLVHRKLGLEVPHDLLDVLEANDNLRNERNPVGIQSPIVKMLMWHECASPFGVLPAFVTALSSLIRKVKP